jgi:hypothetical protein
MTWRRLTFAVLVFATFLNGCRDGAATTTPASKPQPAEARSVVVWISIDGLRPDYIDRADAPLLRRFIREGASSRQLVPCVPSLTFPSHECEATGVPPGKHGVVSNEFYDQATKKLWEFPARAELLEAEPIWLTAKRQSVRTLVYDWPLSQNQRGEVRCDYSLDQFDNDLTDAQRLQRIIDAWRSDKGQGGPLRLIMGYVKGTDPAGHKFGPDSREVEAKLAETDALLKQFVDDATAVFREQMSPDRDRLYVLITTDHGMAPVKTLVNFRKLLSTPEPEGARLVSGGTIAMVHLDELAGGATKPAADAVAAALVKDLRRHEFLHAYTRTDLPPEWGLKHPARVGDVVVLLKPGYLFSSKPETPTVPITQYPDAPRGAHGYDPAECPEMLGFCALWRYPDPLPARDLGKVSVLQIHPTVAQLLRIAPARGVDAQPLPTSESAR